MGALLVADKEGDIVDVLFNLFWLFAKVGLFTVGGGPAILPLVQQALISQNLMTLQETIDMVALSQMTPGPFAINAATFAGMRLNGLSGATAATLGAVLPSIVIVTVVAHYFFRFSGNVLWKTILGGLRPVIPALILSAVVTMVPSALFPSGHVQIELVVIMFAAAVITHVSKLNPAWLILGAGVIGAIFFR